MKRCTKWLLGFFLLLGPCVWGQQPVRIGQYRFIPEQNLRTRGTGRVALRVEDYLNGKARALVQFAALPTPAQREMMAREGVLLQDYLGGNAYYARLNYGPAVVSSLRRAGGLSLMGIRPEWKLDSRLAPGLLPEYAVVDEGRARLLVYYSRGLRASTVKSLLEGEGATVEGLNEALAHARVVMPLARLNALAYLPWVVQVLPVEAPRALRNGTSRVMLRGDALGRSTLQGGWGLEGEGVRVAVLDGNVEPHVDFGSRLHMQEFELSVAETDGHGMHVAGTVGGAGMLDPVARGFAPKAALYTYNFTRGSSGVSPEFKMVEALEQFDVQLTQNSYGPDLNRLCDFYDRLSYNSLGMDFNLDLLANLFPNLTHVFAAGNEAGACGHLYGSSTNRAKNVIHVGAVDARGAVASYSSRGPMDDGRLLPTVCALGSMVYSTMPGDGYGHSSGTSMACPAVTGTLALLTERYMQLHQGQTPHSALLRGLIANTAEDRGNPGPDYEYGYGLVNAEYALRALERGWYTKGTLSEGDAPARHVIPLPVGMKAGNLRVMLVWNDTVANAEYAYGESALVNDLDLLLEAAGQRYQPWMLEAAQPEAAAKRGRDGLNNIEQVTLEEPAGEVTAIVEPMRVASTSQEYFLVWFFEAPSLRILYPNGGEQLEPGQLLSVRVEHGVQPWDVELSYDGGKSYRTLSRGETLNVATVRIPTDAPATSHGLLRVSDATSHDVCAVPFTIMGIPTNLAIEQGDCAATTWRLTWEAVEGAAEYAVLKGDVEGGSFHEIARVSTTEYTLREADVSTSVRNLYSVQAVGIGGELSRRAVGVLASGGAPVVVSAKVEPFSERFEGYPSRYLRLELGENMRADYRQNPVNAYFRPGTHFLTLRPREDTPEKEWFKDEPFKTTVSKARAVLCQLDLRGVQKGKRPILAYEFIMGYADTVEYSQLRFTINGAVATDMAGKSEYRAITEDDKLRFAGFDLSEYVGRVITVALEYVGKKYNDYVMLESVELYEAHDRVDARLLELTAELHPAQDGSTSRVTVLVENHSGVPLPQVPLVLRVDGKQVAAELVKDMKPFEQRYYTFRHLADFSAGSPFGSAYGVEVECLLPGDVNREYDSRTLSVVNNGAATLYPFPDYVGGMGNFMAIDPYLIREVEGTVYLTDCEGAWKDYRENHDVTVKYKPKTPNHALVASFIEFETDGGGDFLALYTVDLPEEVDHEGVEPNYLLKGRVKDCPTIASNAEDGGITFYFHSDGRKKASGWRAILQEVPRENSLSISMDAFNGYYPTGKAEVKVAVENHLSQPAKGLMLGYRLNGGEWVKEAVATLDAKGKVVHTFAEPVTWSTNREDRFECLLFSQDLDVSDNRVEYTFRNERYCHATTFKDRGKRTIAKFTFPTGSLSCPSATGSVVYNFGSPLKLYGDMARQLVVHLNSAAETGEALGVWVDWNADGTFGDASSGEFYSMDLTVGMKSVNFPLDIPTSIKPGGYRMRCMVAQKDKLQPCLQEELPYGEMVDCLLQYEGEKFPVQNDLGIATLKLPKPGRLTAAEQLVVRVKNHGMLRAENVKVLYSVNGGKGVSDEIPVVEPFQEVPLTFNNVDLSAPLLHRVKVWVEVADEQEANNSKEGEVLCVQPEPNGAYFLSVSDDAERKEQVSLGTLANANLNNEMTYEAWVNLNDNELNNIFYGKGVNIAAMNQPNTLFPPHALVVIIEDGAQVAFTGANVVKPGQWQHVAVVMKNKSNPLAAIPVEVVVYVNGESVPLTQMGAVSMKSNGSKPLMVAPRMDGSIDEVRIWKKCLSKAEITAGMYQHVRGSDGKLPQGCVAEFTFDEGPGNAASLSDGFLAMLPEGRNVAAPEGMWRDEYAYLADAVLTGQSEPLARLSAATPNEYEVSFEPGTQLGKVMGSLIPAWPKGTFSYKGNPVTPDTEYDFSNGTVDLLAEVKDLFGKTYSAPVVLRAAQGKAKGCAILSLALQREFNSALPEDIEVKPITQSMEITLPVGLTLEEAVLNFTLSPGAKAFAGSEELTSGVSRVKLSKPLIIDVVSENGENSTRYILSALRGQELSWPLERSEFTYGEGPVLLTGESTAGLPVEYCSSNPGVVTAVGGKLYISGIGETDVVATQRGSGNVAPAKGISHKFTVAHRRVTVQPKRLVINAGDPLPDLILQYDALVQPEHRYRMVEPKYAVVLEDGREWNASLGAIPMGEHSLVPVNAGKYISGNYEVEPLEGTLVVLKGSSRSVSFVITDGAAPLPDAQLTINGVQLQSDASGHTAVNLPLGEYPYAVSLEGYQQKRGTVSVVTADVEVPVVLPKLDITLTYSAGAGGILVGNAQQRVAKEGSGSPILAVPEEGYLFKQWSDGKGDNPRQDAYLSTDLEVQAEFEVQQFRVHYIAGEGGSIQGKAEQNVAWGKDGEEVYAEGDADHFFYAWDDGITTATRKENEVESAKQFTALFASKLFTLPYSQNFNVTTNLPTGWLNVDRLRHGVYWLIGNRAVNPLAMDFNNADGYYAFIHSDALKRGNQQDAELITPFFNLDGVTGDVTVSFKLWFTVLASKPVVSGFYYTLDGGRSWIRLQDINQFSIDWEKKNKRALKGEEQSFTIDAAALSGAKSIAFKWDYKATWSYYIAIDDFKVDAATVSQYIVAYEAGDGGSVNGEKRINAVRTAADPAFEVEAQPEPGYAFAYWSDNGSAQAKRKDAQSTFARAIFQRQPVYFTLLYRADGHGEVQGITYREKVLQGSDGTPVYAKANDGYMFVRWSDGVEANPRVDSNIQGGIDVTAEFVTQPFHKLSYVVDNAKGGSIEGNSEQMVGHGEAGKQVTVKVNPGYRFAGWEDGTMNPTRVDGAVTADRVYIAYFLPNRYFVSFDGNGASAGDMARQAMLYDLPLSLPSCAYTLEGKRFMGWALSPDGDVRFANAARVENLTVKPEATVPLYAVWNDYPLVNFRVVHADRSPVEGARIAINGESKGETGANGVLSIHLKPGDYSYAVTGSGFSEKSGTFTVENEDMELMISVDHATPVAMGTIPVLFPNPTESMLVVEHAEMVKLATIRSLQGYSIHKVDGTGEATLVLPVQFLPAGSYLLELTRTDGSRVVLKFVKR